MTSINSLHSDSASRFRQLCDDLTGWCDPDFDTSFDDLEREFAELRFTINTHGSERISL